MKFRGLDTYEEIKTFHIIVVKNSPFLFHCAHTHTHIYTLTPPHTPTPFKEGWKRCAYSHLYLLSYFFFKSAGSCSFLSDLLPPLNIFTLSLLCKAFKHMLNSRPVSALLMYKYVFTVYLAASDLGLPLPYFLFLFLSTPTKKIQFFVLSLGSAFLLYF